MTGNMLMASRERKRPEYCGLRSSGRLRSRLAVLVLLVFGGTTHAAEIASNGVGGGPWSDPATWRGKTVPGAKDDVVIQKNDVVVFDRNDDGKTSCGKLLIDPRGGLTFKTGGGKLVCAVADGIESFGAIRLDGTKSASDDFELRLIGDALPKRLVKVAKGGALLLYGASGLPEGQVNVALTAPQTAGQKEDLLGQVETDGGASIDWQRAHVGDVKLPAKKIDNTGAKPNERIKLVDNRFSGAARVYCVSCDTPELVRNTFDNRKGKPVVEPAINIYASQLAEIRENTVHGEFGAGITINIATDAVLIGNTIEKCAVGIQGGGGVPNVMIKQATIRGCEAGISLASATGVLEDVLVEGTTTAFYQTASKLQLNNFRVKDLLPKKGIAVSFDSGTLSLLNCELRSEDIQILPQKPADKGPPEIITSLQYVVVAVKGAPAGALVEVRTSKPAPAVGAADPNVRGSPVPVIDGLTPLPQSVTPLIVKAWSFDALGKPLPVPEYTVKVLVSTAKPGADRPVIATQIFRPAPTAFRAELNDKKPTLEVPLK